VTEILTSDELQALLELVGEDGASVGRRAASNVSLRAAEPFDFRNARRLKPETLAPLESGARGVARPLAAALGQVLRLPVAVGPVTIGQTGARALRESLPAPCFLYVLGLGAVEGTGFLAFEPAFASTVVDRMLGGTGATPPPSREPTRVVIALARPFAELVLGAVRGALREVMPLPLSIERLETDPAIAFRAVPTGELFVTVELHVEAPPLQGTLRLALPARVVAECLKRLSGPAEPKSAAAPRKTLGPDAPLAALPVDGVAVLGEAQLPMRALVALEPGDVLRLDRRATDLVELRFAGATKFKGRLGSHAGRLAVKLVATKDTLRPAPRAAHALK
jgi:flagellar motor switch protein FliM